ncbi:T9SS type B sorting domain-containing protein [Flavobacterium sp. N1736]|uniref:T9SS type B sorting domain-containing protein n=1 Tax=Flavobacterium sp. N1736 TaxID=2986823 RepID=UPI00222558A8|nr:T9SS type B sorting domain-containing protein [Flavobacterium sp. N1736]
MQNFQHLQLISFEQTFYQKTRFSFWNTISFQLDKNNSAGISTRLRLLQIIVFFMYCFAMQGQCTVNTINADFEYPVISSSGTNIHQDTYAPQLGWRTTATDGQLEFWKNGGTQNRYAYSGTQFVELNANQSSGLYQDYDTSIATYFNYSFAHMGRDGVDKMVLKAGPPGGPYTTVTTVSTGKKWELYGGTYTVPNGQIKTRFIFEALSTATSDLTVGNFLDAINFTATIDPPKITDGDVDPVSGAIVKTINTNTSTTFTVSGYPGAIISWYDSTGSVLLHQGTTFTTPILTVNTKYKLKQKSSANCESSLQEIEVRIETPTISAWLNVRDANNNGIIEPGENITFILRLSNTDPNHKTLKNVTGSIDMPAHTTLVRGPEFITPSDNSFSSIGGSTYTDFPYLWNLDYMRDPAVLIVVKADCDLTDIMQIETIGRIYIDGEEVKISVPSIPISDTGTWVTTPGNNKYLNPPTLVNCQNSAGCPSGLPVATSKVTVLNITNPSTVFLPATIDLATTVNANSSLGILSYWKDSLATIPLTNSETVAVSGTYYIKNTTPNGCQIIKPVVVTVNPKPAIIDAKGITICKGESGSLTATTDSKAETVFTGTWNPLTDPKTYMPTNPRVNPGIPTPPCSFNSTATATYHTKTFSVNVTGIYTMKLTGLNTDYRAGYIYKGNYTLGTCPGDGTWIVEGDDYGVSGGQIPTLTARLEVGTLYTLVSLVNASISQKPIDYTWTLTPPEDGGFFLNPTNSWYTSETGGNPIAWGSNFNPAGVPGSGLPDTNTPGKTTYYIWDGITGSPRIAVDFVILPEVAKPIISTTASTCSMEGINKIDNYVGGNTYTFDPLGPEVSASSVITGMIPGIDYTVTSRDANTNCTSTASAQFSKVAFDNSNCLPFLTTAVKSITKNVCNTFGEIISYEITISNTGFETAKGVELNLIFPTGMSFDSATASYSNSASGPIGQLTNANSSTNPIVRGFEIPFNSIVIISLKGKITSVFPSGTYSVNAQATYNDPTSRNPNKKITPYINSYAGLNNYEIGGDVLGSNFNGSLTTDDDVKINAMPLTPTMSKKDATCSAAATSTISNYVAGNTYTFDPAGPTVDTAGLISGMVIGTPYSVTSGDTNCTSAASVPFSNAAQLATAEVPTITAVTATCSAAATSTISNYVAGNIYTFDPAGPTVDTAGLISGMVIGTPYTVTSGDANCTSAASVPFSNAAQLTTAEVPVIEKTPATCSAAATSTISNYVLGNTYTFDPAGPTVDTAGLISGMVIGTPYTVTSGDANCTSAASVPFSNAAQLATAEVPTITAVTATCSAAATSTISNYVLGNTYAFDPTGPTVDTAGLISGMVIGTPYSVTSGDTNCTSAASVPFSNAAQLATAEVPTITAVTATCSAAATSTISNYVAGNIYTFDPAGPTVDTAGLISGMVIGTPYTVTSGDTSCTSAASVPFSNTAQLATAEVPTITAVTATCSAAATSTISNYVLGNTYAFDPTGPTVDTAGLISGMVIGTPYTVTSGDANCTSAASVPFSNAAQLTTAEVPTITAVTATCSAAATSTISNYVLGNTYAFDPTGPTVDTAGLISGMVIGTPYTATSGDANCTSAASVPFSNAAQLITAEVPTITAVTATCSAAATSTISNYALGNTYTFVPAGPTVDTAGLISGMVIGTPYSVTSGDTNCTSAASVPFSNAAQLATAEVPVIEKTPATCSAAATSTIGNYVLGNTYTFDPAGPTVDTAGLIRGMVIGTPYTVTSGDANCTSAASVPFSNAAQLATAEVPTITAVTATCSAAATSTISNYVAGNTYTFDPTGPTVDTAGLISGMVIGASYSVTSGDTNCTSAASVPFSNAAQLITAEVPTITAVTATCSAAATSTISNYVAGNIYTFVPAGPTVDTAGLISGMIIGTPYTVTSGDANCTSAASVPFSNAAQLATAEVPTITAVTATCSAAATSTISNYVLGNTYAFDPTGPTVDTAGLISGMVIGASYSVTSGDTNCTSAASVPFSNAAQLITAEVPTITAVTATCSAAATSTISNYVAGNIYTFDPAGPTVDTAGLISGMVIGTPYTVTSGDTSCTSAASVPFSNTAQLATAEVPTITAVTATCSAAATSTISNYVLGNTYAFDPTGPTVDTAGLISGMVIGTPYTVTSGDANCTSAASVPFSNAAQLTTAEVPTLSTVTQPTCETTTGSFTITNYDILYNYTITPETGVVQTGAIVVAPVGQYLVYAKNGDCKSEPENVFIIAPSTLTADLVTNSIIPEYCSADKDGSFKIEITGGIMPYTVSLDNKNGTYTEINDNENTFMNLGGGSHTVYIKDASDCVTELEVIMPKATVINPVANVSYSCLNDIPSNSVTISVDPSITDLNDLDYSLDGITYQSDNTFVNIPPGSHTIKARHTNGCTQSTREFIVDYIEPLTLTLADGELNEIVATTTGGEGQYRYSFEGESYSTVNKFIIYKSGTYTVTVTDKNGCTATASRYFEYIDVCIPNHFTPNGDGVNDEWGPGCSINYKHLTFTIFDRHGRIIGNYMFGQKWDGKYNGTELSSGDYWYVLKLNDNKDNREFVGHFTLYR